MATHPRNEIRERRNRFEVWAIRIAVETAEVSIDGARKIDNLSRFIVYKKKKCKNAY